MAASFPAGLQLRPRTIVAEGHGLKGKWVFLLEHCRPTLTGGRVTWVMGVNTRAREVKISVYPSPAPKCKQAGPDAGPSSVWKATLCLVNQNLQLWTLTRLGKSRIPCF